MQAKGIFKLIYKIIVLEVEVKTFRTANKALNKRKKVKKTRVRAKKSFNALKAIAL